VRLLAAMRGFGATTAGQILTLGQYLRPSTDHLPICTLLLAGRVCGIQSRKENEWVSYVESGPLVPHFPIMPADQLAAITGGDHGGFCLRCFAI